MTTFRTSLLKHFSCCLVLFFCIEVTTAFGQNSIADVNVEIKEIRKAIRRNDSIWLDEVRIHNLVNIQHKGQMVQVNSAPSDWSLKTNFYARCRCFEITEYTVYEYEEDLIVSLYYIDRDEALNLIVNELPKDHILFFDRKCRLKGLRKR